jgi:hypothetical protein
MRRSLLRLGTIFVALILAMGFLAGPAANAAGPTTVLLGTTAGFSVLGGTTVTNTGPTTMDRNLGVSPGSAVTGFPPGLVTPPGTIHAADAVALQAQSDLTIAYNDAAGRPTSADETGVDLGTQTLVGGVYGSTSGLALTGTVTLDGENDPSSVWIFKAGSTLVTASGSSVNLIRGASACNVFWQVGSSATIGTTTKFVGTILALTSIAMQTGASLNGRALARNGAVTLASNTIITSTCAGAGQPTDTTPPICVLTDVIAGPPKQLKITVQDTGSGLGSIIVTTAVNVSVSVPVFPGGTTSAIVVTGTKLNQSLAAQVGLTVTDRAGNKIVCDPVITTLVRGKGQATTETYENLPRAESKIMIMNGTPGMDEVVFVVNGKRFKVDDLNDGLTTTIDVASAMKRGNHNTIVIKAHGDRGASVTIVIHD